MDKEKALRDLIHITNRNAGFTASTPVDFNALCLLIKNKTAHSISLSSIKRIWGYVEYKSFPSPNTLNILARFNGYENWETFLAHHDVNDNPETSGYFFETMVTVDSLSEGQMMEVKWGSDKWCQLEYLSDYKFRVVDSNNIKLKPEDTLRLHTLCVGLPFYAIDIKRKNKIIPGYIGAKKRGITSIVIK